RTGNAIDAVDLQFFFGISVTLRRQTVRRIGEVQRTVGLVDEIVGTVELLALIRVREHGDWRLRVQGFQSPDVASRMSGDSDAPVCIERHAIRAGLGASEGRRFVVSTGMDKDARTLARGPQDDVIRRDLGKKQAALAR